jgi:hypothetical protein
VECDTVSGRGSGAVGVSMKTIELTDNEMFRIYVSLQARKKFLENELPKNPNVTEKSMETSIRKYEGLITKIENIMGTIL